MLISFYFNNENHRGIKKEKTVRKNHMREVIGSCYSEDCPSNPLSQK